MQSFDSQHAPDAAGLMVILIAGLIGLVIGLAILAAICYFISGHYKIIPPEYRKMEPNKVWLMMIPLFGLYWVFPVFLGLSDSYKAAFDAKGRTDVGDCGRQIGLIYCICAACSIIPCVQYLAAPAALVLLIIYLVKVSDLKTKLLAP